MRILGIDPGSETTGWGVIEGDGRRYRLVDFGSIKASAGTLQAGRPGEAVFGGARGP